MCPIAKGISDERGAETGPSPDPTSTTSPPAEIALVVVTRDRPQLVTRHLIPSLRAAALEDVEVLVIDQSRGDATAVPIGELPGVEYMRGEPGLARGRNQAIAATSAPLVAFTDDDVSFPPNWPKLLVDAFHDAPEVGAVCGRGIDDPGRLLPGRPPGVYRFPTIPFALGSGFNIAFRREALEAAGPFDEQLGAGARFRAAEDSDMLYRVMRAGWSVLCSDGIQVQHHDWRPLGARIRMYRDYGLGAGAQTVKHARAGDRTAARLATVEIGRHLMTIVRSLVSLRAKVAAFQIAWLAGLALGVVRSYRALGGSQDETRPTEAPQPRGR